MPHGRRSLTISIPTSTLPFLAAGRRSPLLRRRVREPRRASTAPPLLPVARPLSPPTHETHPDPPPPDHALSRAERKKENGGGSRVAQREGRRPGDAGDTEVSPGQASFRLQHQPYVPSGNSQGFGLTLSSGCCRGAEPKQLAFSAALGLTIGIFPICGTPSLRPSLPHV
jgi:hypothetical protein